MFLFFKYLFSSHAQPLLTVHYIITGFSECHLHMHSHYQMCTIFVRFSEFVLFFVLLKYAATTRCALYSMGFSEFLLRMHSHYRLRTIFMGFSDFSPSNTQPLPNVHYDMTFSELLLHIHSHYQMCLLYSMGFSDFFFRIRSHCIHGMSWFLSLQTRPLQIVHYIRGIFWVYSHFWHVKPLQKVCTSHEIFGGIFVCLFCKQC